MCGIHRCFVYERDRTTLSSNPVIALALHHHLLTGCCSCNLEVFGNDALKRILGDRNVKKEGGCSRDFVAQLTFDLELHGSNYYKSRQVHGKIFTRQCPLLSLEKR